MAWKTTTLIERHSITDEYPHDLRLTDPASQEHIKSVTVVYVPDEAEYDYRPDDDVIQIIEHGDPIVPNSSSGPGLWGDIRAWLRWLYLPNRRGGYPTPVRGEALVAGVGVVECDVPRPEEEL
jgi:hypothetical protein